MLGIQPRLLRKCSLLNEHRDQKYLANSAIKMLLQIAAPQGRAFIRLPISRACMP